jgi:hypothetical protein
MKVHSVGHLFDCGHRRAQTLSSSPRAPAGIRWDLKDLKVKSRYSNDVTNRSRVDGPRYTTSILLDIYFHLLSRTCRHLSRDGKHGENKRSEKINRFQTNKRKIQRPIAFIRATRKQNKKTTESELVVS